MKTLRLERLTREAFAPFGDVIELAGARHFPINGGTTERYHDLANVDVCADGGRPLINLFRAQPRAWPIEIAMMERHPHGSQAFVPLADVRYLVVVAPAGEFDVARMCAFVSDGWQGVNYARGVWHHPLLALDRVSDFVVVDRGGVQPNCDEIELPVPLRLAMEAG
ncbi:MULTISPECIES: ureidoglycolate lyase [Paraburkholderia]|uniref:ureidoglycolate lyase n=1 Tax=Paraburkholderia TaxID=1822464 RepID=UPI002256F9CB|nr:MULTISPECIES: ureidoglycolate lyase [Paraburkholderia]MCX4159993.1 ureidoglycolate lyase [Paraburkholderia megapolitana]MDN7155493.1 ureidoglycolate lyase [Paraburkholderia sp. CHISQ3]MDQ6492537.1 ureidoglycolate lyase [Paraburkholderia megapolitana]